MKFTNLILTISDYNNYGNRLQNYALYRLLSSYGLTSTIYSSIDNLAPEKNLCNVFKEKINDLYSSFFSSERAIQCKKKYNCRLMSRIYIPDYRFSYSMVKGLICSPQDSFYRLVIGSDQVWNYKWLTPEGIALRLGSFVSDTHPIISYAASFGVSKIDDNIIPIFQRYLPRLRAISVREDRGAELVKEMTGLDATVVLDPTLMLDVNQWNNITRKIVSDSDRYVLIYFLGKTSDEQEQIIQDYARKHDCRVRRILDLRDRETYVAGPQDFVELFSKAQYVFTDSYHACCFSILYHKQFTVFNRAGIEDQANMNSRMETLFRLFDLDAVVMDRGLAPQIDYDKVDKLLAQHREESQAWLDKAMEA